MRSWDALGPDHNALGWGMGATSSIILRYIQTEGCITQGLRDAFIQINQGGGGESEEGYVQVSAKYSGEMGVREVFGDFCGEISTNVSTTREDLILRCSHQTCILYDKLPDA